MMRHERSNFTAEDNFGQLTKFAILKIFLFFVQVSQIGVSACGATAVINVLSALEFPHSLEQVGPVGLGYLPHFQPYWVFLVNS